MRTSYLIPLLLLCLSSCSPQAVQHRMEATPPASSPIRNLILLIGDGMGPQQLGLLFAYDKHVRHAPSALAQLIDAGSSALVTVEPYNALVVDSACSTSQLASGVPARSQTIGLNILGDPVESILEKAQRRGKSVGLVSDTRITHATPASFAAHVSHRSEENQIAEQLIDARVDVLFSGGLRHFLPQSDELFSSEASLKARHHIPDTISAESKRSDQIDLLERAQSLGYALAFDANRLDSIPSPPVLGLFASSALPHAIASLEIEKDHALHPPTLREMTRHALRLLEQNPEGFFLMVEGGQIDWAGHGNDAGLLLQELLRFDAAIDLVLTWAARRTDTLIVLTADHETGGFGFSYSGYQIPEPQTIKGSHFTGEQHSVNYNFISPGTLQSLAAQKKSLLDITELFDTLPEAEKDPEQLIRLVSEHTGYRISMSEAERILETKPNPFFKKGHPDLSAPLGPAIHDFQAFYPTIDKNRGILLSRVLSSQQGIVWSTGTHTSTPVLATALGPDQEKFTGLKHSTEIGLLCMEALGVNE